MSVLTSKLFVFSGIDGAGKTTQIERVERHLHGSGVKTCRVWARGGYTPIFCVLKRVMRLVRGRSLPQPGRSSERDRLLKPGWRRRVWLYISILDLFVYYGIWLRCLKLAGFVVLSDRYVLDTALDFQINFPEDRVTTWRLWRFLERFVPTPDSQFMFLIPIGESVRRSAAKNEPFPDSVEVLEIRYAKYYEACSSGSYQLFDGLAPRETITQGLLAAMGSPCQSSR